MGLCGYLSAALLAAPAGGDAGLGAAVAAAVVIALSALFAVGWHDRTAAFGLLCCCVYLLARDPSVLGTAWAALIYVLLLHFLMPDAPYGSVTRMSRADPGTFWRVSPGIYSAAWIGLAGVYAYGGVTVLIRDSPLSGSSAAVGLVAMLLAACGLRRRRRVPLWIAMAAAQAGLAMVGDTAIANGPVLMLLALAFDPGWVPPAVGQRLRVFYDGDCGLCHRAVRFVLSEDRNGTDFRFAPLGCEAFERAVPVADRPSLPDSVVVVRGDGALLLRSQAILEIGRRLGGFWRVLAVLGGWLPRGWRDACYDLIAALRKRLFARPEAECPLIPPYLRGRFQPDALEV